MNNDLWSEIREEMEMLDKALSEIKPRGRDRAQTDHDYRMALSKRIIELRADGCPATVLLDISRGESRIAQLRLNRDIADSLYTSALEAINVQKIKIRVLEGQLAREWGNPK